MCLKELFAVGKVSIHNNPHQCVDIKANDSKQLTLLLCGFTSVYTQERNSSVAITQAGVCIGYP